MDGECEVWRYGSRAGEVEFVGVGLKVGRGGGVWDALIKKFCIVENGGRGGVKVTGVR